ncbi:hypothetical protein GYMLUDRAFT_250651 [Collybiopsis luxurians FD-317 M1]|uniref:Unplaced genomic scaffold GYMLUscaffold_85, whole genome shotgun sequence n=1 Tax=Collybiopsis luxurians FD-317 M1 TaxID=944289 RepID=A0A0D0C5H4_9AGAR|nr:hypothetical protein GYMLUDRAFT_250651 [Collybiopsis luxurians FD-317 M1]
MANVGDAVCAEDVAAMRTEFLVSRRSGISVKARMPVAEMPVSCIVRNKCPANCYSDNPPPRAWMASRKRLQHLHILMKAERDKEQQDMSAVEWMPTQSFYFGAWSFDEPSFVNPA